LKKEAHVRKKHLPSFPFRGAAFAFLALLLLCWVAVFVHPDSFFLPGRAGTLPHANLVSELDAFSAGSREAASAAANHASAGEEHFVIGEAALSAPMPDALSYGETYRARDVAEVVEDAVNAGLLSEDEKTIFSVTAALDKDSPILYYIDDSLLTICWQETVDGHLCTFCEVKTADPSQIRRKLSQDAFAPSSVVYPTDLAVSANAVAAVTGDGYSAHDLGISVYQREIRRFKAWPYSFTLRCYNAVDTLFLDASGNFRFSPAGASWSREGIEQYVSENDILFSLTCGPILVADGQAMPQGGYPFGSPGRRAARSAIAQCGPLHYLYVSVSTADGRPGCTASELAGMLQAKGVQHAYALSGGRSAELVFGGEVYRPLDNRSEKPCTDLIVFATALPEKRGE
jgi:exopolysaccharide biosynthesis protein